MSVSHICGQCRRRIIFSSLQAHKATRWQRGAHFTAFTESKPDSSNNGRANSPSENGIEVVERTTFQRSSIAEQNKQSSPAAAGDLLEILFAESVAARNDTKTAPRNKQLPLEAYENVETLNRLIKNRHTPVHEAWKYFLSRFGSGVSSSEESLRPWPASLPLVAGKLLNKIIQSEREDVSELSMSEIIGAFQDAKVLRATHLHNIILSLLERLGPEALLSQMNSQDSVGIAQSHQPIVEELIEAWRLLVQMCAPASGRDKFTSVPYSHWPLLYNFSSRSYLSADKIGTTSMKAHLRYMLPRHPKDLAVDLPRIAILTFAVLARRKGLTNGLSTPELKFRVSLASSISLLTTSDIGYIVDQFKLNLSKEVQGPICDNIRDRAADIVKVERSNTPSNPVTGLKLSHNVDLASVRMGLSRAEGKKDITQLARLWSTTSRQFREMTHQQDPGISNNDSSMIYNEFIMAFLRLNHTEMAIEVWNGMVELGLQPDLKTWSKMLTVCKKERDIRLVENIWAKMLSSGVQPDEICWSIRLSSLAEYGTIESCIRGFEEMSERWTAAAREKHPSLDASTWYDVGDIDGVAKPSTNTINAIILGLLRRQRTAAAHKILALGDKLGIKPDVGTFNTLLRPLIREGRSAEASRLLSQMQAQGVQADAVTFTTILDATFRSADGLSPDEQEKLLTNIYTEMEASGLSASLHLHGKIIYSLLRLGGDTTAAVRSVLARVARQGVNLSPHIYTMLAEHYFRQAPPQLDAMRLLLEHVSSARAPTDHIFWDRVIEGYARAGDTATALRILAVADGDAALRVGWHALGTLASALADQGSWELVKELATNVRADRGPPPKDDEKGKQAQHAFWNFVRSRGMIDE